MYKTLLTKTVFLCLSKMSSASVLPVVRVGGVPEHFNLPWHLALETGAFELAGVRVEWVNLPLGTGQMIAALKANEVDLIVALTEGLVADIATSGGGGAASSIKLLGTYVESPLTWAISTGPNHERVHQVADLVGARVGISRLTSGSHLMSCVLASQRGWQQDETRRLTFVVEGSFQSLRESVRAGRTDAFMWESFTSKPYHLNGELRRVGEITTPWPCFLLASHPRVLERKRAALAIVLGVIQTSCRAFTAADPAIVVPEIAKRYGLRNEDAAAWYAGVSITASQTISEATLEQALQALKDAGVLTSHTYPTDLPLTAFVDATSVTLEADIRSMRLYHRPELLTALYNNVRATLGKETGALHYTELLPYDQNHYGGVGALDVCVDACHLKADSRVLQLGSSVGGPSRYLAGAHGCKVLAVELQKDLDGVAHELTMRCGLDQAVRHVAADFLSLAPRLDEASYDCVCSWLTVLHFDRDKRAALLAAGVRLLKPGGYFYAEDFFERAPLTPAEATCLRRDVFCNYLPSLDAYKADLLSVGLEIVCLEDLSVEWTRQTQARVDAFAQQRDAQVAIHGEALVAGLASFYEAIAALFRGAHCGGAHCGGVRVVARKPTAAIN
jgi:sulfonate transport system substrate-binding protein